MEKSKNIAEALNQRTDENNTQMSVEVKYLMYPPLMTHIGASETYSSESYTSFFNKVLRDILRNM